MEHRLCIVGGGPRATYVLLHMLAAWEARPLQARLRIHMIEPVEFGAGAIYCTSQPDYLRLNTIVSQVTAYPDDTVVSPLPLLKGPTLYEWSRTPHNGVAVYSFSSRPPPPTPSSPPSTSPPLPTPPPAPPPSTSL